MASVLLAPVWLSLREAALEKVGPPLWEKVNMRLPCSILRGRDLLKSTLLTAPHRAPQWHFSSGFKH